MLDEFWWNHTHSDNTWYGRNISCKLFCMNSEGQWAPDRHQYFLKINFARTKQAMRMFPEILLCPRFNHSSQIKLCLLLVCAIKKVYEPIFSLLSMFLIFFKKTIFPCIKTICKKNYFSSIYPKFTWVLCFALKFCPWFFVDTLFCLYWIILPGPVKH